MLKGLLLALFLVTPQVLALECVTIEGTQYCVQPKVGNVPVTITDPEALLRAAAASKGGLKKVGLYDDYHRIPVVVELAKQQGMDYDEFVFYMSLRWDDGEFNPFQALLDLELLYDQLSPEFRQILVQEIAGQIADDVIAAIHTVI